ncbi:uncharacterized protein LOC128951654 [Oppia nitens]|uniref:uncharacterized protein LOC128951654 n=1 Tax=Oppia nitens TaxID=1686743 RepID=UPI0023DC4C31|nr:uncharacterized protein LOC128951654 [Oppia nitens]
MILKKPKKSFYCVTGYLPPINTILDDNCETNISVKFNKSSCCQLGDDFSPSVTARCDRGLMYINVVTQQPFWGVVHTHEHRQHPCLVDGQGSLNTTLKVSLLANENDEIYCGVQKYKGERAVYLNVRPHKSLELSDDKNYILTCGQSAYKNVRGGTYKVTLKLTDTNGQRSGRVIHGNSYILRAQLTPYDSITSLRLKSCFAFSDDYTNIAEKSGQVELVDRFGCPVNDDLMSPFVYNSTDSAESVIYEMFKFPDGNKLNIQCDAVLCRGGCQEPVCDSSSSAGSGHKGGRDLALDGYSQLSASTSVYVFEPSDESLTLENLSECTEWRFPWLITLCIILAILLLLMLLVNMFMCSSLTCRCIKTEIEEQEPDQTVDEYDPYRADWTTANSRYGGSRMSINDTTLKSNPIRSHHKSYGDLRSPANTGGGDIGYHNDSYIPDHHRSYSTLPYHRSPAPPGPGLPGPPLSTYSTQSLKKQKPIKTIEIDYSLDNNNNNNNNLNNPNQPYTDYRR